MIEGVSMAVTRSPETAQLRDRLFARLLAAIGSDLKQVGAAVPRLPNTLGLLFPGVIGRELLAATPDVYASTGAACHSGGQAVPQTLRAIGYSAADAQGAVRFSLGWGTTSDEINSAADQLIASWCSLRAKS